MIWDESIKCNACKIRNVTDTSINTNKYIIKLHVIYHIGGKQSVRNIGISTFAFCLRDVGSNLIMDDLTRWCRENIGIWKRFQRAALFWKQYQTLWVNMDEKTIRKLSIAVLAGSNKSSWLKVWMFSVNNPRLCAFSQKL